MEFISKLKFSLAMSHVMVDKDRLNERSLASLRIWFRVDFQTGDEDYQIESELDIFRCFSRTFQ